MMEVSVGSRTVSGAAFSNCVYDQLIREEEGFAGFYGLRDFLYMLKSIKKRSTVQGARMTIELGDFVACIERIFNGKSKRSLSAVVSKFLRLLRIRDPYCGRLTMSLLQEALHDQGGADMSTKAHY